MDVDDSRFIFRAADEKDLTRQLVSLIPEDADTRTLVRLAAVVADCQELDIVVNPRSADVRNIDY